MITTPLIKGEIQFSFLAGGSVFASKGGSFLVSAEEQGVSSELKLMVSVRAAGRVFEVHGKAGRLGFDQEIEFAGDAEARRKQRDAEMALALRQAVLAKPAALLERFDCGLGGLALFHLVCGFPVKAHHVLVK